MVYSVQQIKFEIYSYIKEFGGKFGEWYIGIATDPKATMRLAHGIDEEHDIWLYKQAVSFRACQTVQRHFTEMLGVEGELVSSGPEEADCVYLYKKSPRTRP
ncbi:MAG: hypothetical protein KDK89_15415 [Alphaproteobacteria bacterium]|nr:hypothetical protein [Alphaproteobacteria bacterium]